MTQTNIFTGVNPDNVSLLLKIDSYKNSHFLQQPPGTRGNMSYGGPRSSKLRKVNSVSFFGLQAYVKKYLMKQITMTDVDFAAKVCEGHGEPFDYEHFKLIVEKYDGRLPVTIRAVKEGTEVPIGNALYTVEALEPGLEYLDAFVETALLRSVWYTTSVATVSKSIKKIIKQYLEETSDSVNEELLFKLHDFGARGASSGESAGLGGMAHLTNFMGTDTMEALLYAGYFYGAPMAGFSIPASEHSTITVWGMTDDEEEEAYRNMLKVFGGKGKMFACVSDGRNIFNACEKLWGERLCQEVIASESVLVIRPDSGDPVETVTKVIKILADKFGTTINSKGYKVLNNVRVIQGDGVDLDSIESILYSLKLNGFSTSNIAFGMGGALLQKVDRDTFSFAQKRCSTLINDQWKDVYKDPVGGGKTSMRGRLVLVKAPVPVLSHGEYHDELKYVTMREEEAKALNLENELELVYQNGKLIRYQTFEEIRAIAAL